MCLDAITLEARNHDGWLPVPDAEVRYLADFLGQDEATRYLERLERELAWRQLWVRIGGRRIPSPRLSAWYGDPGTTYTYSGLTLRAEGWVPALGELRARIETASGHTFNCVLANLYRDGQDGMGWHADDEPELGAAPAIASLTLGAPRRFVMRRRSKRGPRVELDLGNGSLLVMSGPTQRGWRHALPKTRRPVGRRVNLTFRRILAPHDDPADILI